MGAGLLTQLAGCAGGSGFVGRSLVRHLLAHGDSVVALNRSDHAASKIQDASGLPPGDSRLVLVRGDLSSRHALEDGMRGCEVVYHSAGATGDWGPWHIFHETNIVGVENVLAAARAQQVKRLVHVSTEAVMIRDDGEVVDADEFWPIEVPPPSTLPIPRAKPLGSALCWTPTIRGQISPQLRSDHALSGERMILQCFLSSLRAQSQDLCGS